MHTAQSTHSDYESGQENNRQQTNPESKEIKQSNRNIKEIDLMKDIIFDLERSLICEY